MFALIYLPHHLKDSEGTISFSEFHLDLVEYGKSWLKPLSAPKQFRDAFIAPRECGKSTWLFTILPIWAAAFMHVAFIAAYSDSATQAQGHLLTFKQELATNELLASDFPDLCEVERGRSNRAMADNSFKTVRDNGFIFTASGVDVSNHGLKHGNLRPQLIILDDIEPGEANYSEYQMRQRLSTIWDDIAPQNIYARMVIVGTTTMPNSIIDQLRKYTEVMGEVPQELKWIDDQNIRVHYYPAIMPNDDGTERSVWPEKWPIEWLTTQRHLRDFAKNYLNKPMGNDGQFWAPEDIRVDEGDYGNTLLSVDPSVTRGKVSDYTGLAVISRGPDGVYVRYANQVKLSPSELAAHCKDLVERFGCGLVYVETNQGGDLWKEVMKDIGVKYRSVHQKVSKEIRAGKALNFYQQGKVTHTDHFPVLVEQMLSFPRVANDDVLDAVVSGVLYFLDHQNNKVEAMQLTYV
jgi:predicted phage terminase large subunit-like protein